MNQSVPAAEIIVVDDGSTDDTAKAAEAAFAEWEGMKMKGQTSPQFKVIRQKNRGPGSARNTGFAASRGEYIHFFDSDDLAAPNKHELQIKALQDSGADIAYGPWIKGRFEQKCFIPESRVLQQRGLPKGDLLKALLTNWSIVPHACLFRRTIVEKAGGFPEHLFVGEDQLMFLRALLAGATVVHSPGTLELYRTEGEQKLTSAGPSQKRPAANWARFLLDANKACAEKGVSPSKWFNFRRRIWESLQDLEKFGVEDPILKADLRAILCGVTPGMVYGIYRAVERKWQGLKSRLGYSRESSFFRVAPPTKEQISLIENMGLHVCLVISPTASVG